MSSRHELIADLLMGAALADRELDGRELDAVKQLLCKAMKRDALPLLLRKHIERFDAKRLDIGKTVAKLGPMTTAQKRNLLELIVAVHESDDLWDFDEDAYLRQVAQALELDESAYADLTMAVSLESTADELSLSDAPAVKPPPLPK